ncbi:RNA-directed DNA polymerase, eukaryota [Tanacetum coccineum]
MHLSAKELGNTCVQYGTVQYVYIQKKLSKQGKPFALARFNKVNDVDTLIRNLRSIWLGNFRIYANVAWLTRESKPKSFSHNSEPKEPMHVNSKPKQLVHSYGYTPSLAKVVKGNEVQEVVWIDVEGTPLQAWSHATFNRIPMILKGKVLVVRVKEVTRWVLDFWENDIAQSEDGSDNNSAGIHKWEEENDDQVIPDSFQSIRKEYNIVENSPDHVENSFGKMENSPDHMDNFDVHVENSHEQLENYPDHVENSHVHVENSTEQMENSPNHVDNSYVHVENSHVHLENCTNLSGDPFGLKKLILESEKSAPM